MNEMGAKHAEEQRIQCSALQAHLFKRSPGTIDHYYGQGQALKWSDLQNDPKLISHTLLRDVAVGVQESKEKYQNQFTEQFVGGQRLQLDHSNK